MCCESQPIAHGRVHSKGAGAPDGADPLRMGRQEHRMGGAGGGHVLFQHRNLGMLRGTGDAGDHQGCAQGLATGALHLVLIQARVFRQRGGSKKIGQALQRVALDAQKSPRTQLAMIRCPQSCLEECLHGSAGGRRPGNTGDRST